MKKKGQALVEFIIILPIFIMLVLGVMDVGKILYSKITLENTLSDAITLSEKNYTLDETKKELKLKEDLYNFKIEEDGNYKTYILEKKVDIITPGLNFLFKNPYYVVIKRSIPNE